MSKYLVTGIRTPAAKKLNYDRFIGRTGRLKGNAYHGFKLEFEGEQPFQWVDLIHFYVEKQEKQP